MLLGLGLHILLKGHGCIKPSDTLSLIIIIVVIIIIIIIIIIIQRNTINTIQNNTIKCNTSINNKKIQKQYNTMQQNEKLLLKIIQYNTIKLQYIYKY